MQSAERSSRPCGFRYEQYVLGRDADCLQNVLRTKGGEWMEKLVEPRFWIEECLRYDASSHSSQSDMTSQCYVWDIPKAQCKEESSCGVL